MTIHRCYQDENFKYTFSFIIMSTLPVNETLLNLLHPRAAQDIKFLPEFGSQRVQGALQIHFQRSDFDGLNPPDAMPCHTSMK